MCLYPTYLQRVKNTLQIIVGRHIWGPQKDQELQKLSCYRKPADQRHCQVPRPWHKEFFRWNFQMLQGNKPFPRLQCKGKPQVVLAKDDVRETALTVKNSYCVETDLWGISYQQGYYTLQYCFACSWTQKCPTVTADYCLQLCEVTNCPPFPMKQQSTSCQLKRGYQTSFKFTSIRFLNETSFFNITSYSWAST